MTSRHRKLEEALRSLERVMRELNLWQSEAPPPAALHSDQPFAVDKLKFHQWLQFIFVAKMSYLAEQRLPLPHSCAIAPMAEEVFKGDAGRLAPLIGQLRDLDRLFEI